MATPAEGIVLFLGSSNKIALLPERLKRLAIAEKRSVSQLAAIAIQEYLDKAEANQDKGAA